MPLILELRVPFLDPSFECMVSQRRSARPLCGNATLTLVATSSTQVRMQTHFATDGYEKLGGVQRYFAEGVREEYAAGGLDAQVRGPLAVFADRAAADCLGVLSGRGLPTGDARAEYRRLALDRTVAWGWPDLASVARRVGGPWACCK